MPRENRGALAKGGEFDYYKKKKQKLGENHLLSPSAGSSNVSRATKNRGEG